MRPISLAFQDLRAGQVLEQFGSVHEMRRCGAALAEELLGLVVPMAALLVVALSQRNHGVGLRRIGKDDDLRRRPAAV